MKKIVKNTLLALGMTLAAAALISRWPEIQPRLSGSNWSLLFLVALGLLGYQFLNAGVWSLVLNALGHKSPFGKTAKIWLQSEALRWLPGGIWGYGSRVLNAKELGVSKPKASSSLILEIALTNIAWALTATLVIFTPLLPLALTKLSNIFSRDSMVALLFGVSAACMAALALALYLTKKKIHSKKLLHLLPWRELKLKSLSNTLLSYLGLCFFNGLLLWLVIKAVPNLSISPLMALGIGGSAWLAGFWAIGVPGGIGVREAALATMLAVFGDMDSAITVAVLWRTLQVSVEIISLLLVSLPIFNIQKENLTQDLPFVTKAKGKFKNFRLLNYI